jgi:hypothetical protein
MDAKAGAQPPITTEQQLPFSRRYSHLCKGRNGPGPMRDGIFEHGDLAEGGLIWASSQSCWEENALA